MVEGRWGSVYFWVLLRMIALLSWFDHSKEMSHLSLLDYSVQLSINYLVFFVCHCSKSVYILVCSFNMFIVLTCWQC